MMNILNIQVKDLPDSEVEITGEISVADFAAYRPRALKRLGEEVSLDGFRKGHVPELVLEKKIGKAAILEEMADMALRDVYPRILSEQNIDAVGAPAVTVTKLAPDNPFAWKIVVAVMPAVSLPDYRMIAAAHAGEVEDVAVTDAEVEETLVELQKIRARRSALEKKDATGAGEESKNNSEEALPPLDDAFIASLGAGFTTLAEARAGIKANIAHEKKLKARDKKRMKMIEEILTNTKCSIPRVMVEAELDRAMGRMKDDIAHAGGTFKDYLAHIKKTEEEVRSEGSKNAERSVKIELLLREIWKKEGLSQDMEKTERDVAEIMSRYKDADPARARAYVDDIYRNEAVFEFLETVKA